MKVKLTLIKMGIKKGFSSKYALVFYLFSALISITVQYFLWKAVLVGKPLAEFKQTMSYLILMQLLTALFPKTSYDLNNEVRSGDIAISLLKPISLIDRFLWEGIGYSIAKFIVVGIAEVVIYFWILNFRFSLVAIFMVTVAIILGYFLYFELELILGTFSFYTYSIWGISTFKDAILLILSGNIFPANFYPNILKMVAKYLPFKYSFGAIGLLSQTPTWSLFLKVISIQLIYILVLNLIFRLLFNRSVNSIVIQGG